ncbi:MAG: hypothetical protein KA149_06035 [Chitinophagales bacterium]|nr:hypothetical protein [Chitinophagales bacterium]
MKKLLTGFCTAILLCLVATSCKKDARTQWDTEMLVPIATTNLSLSNLVKDTTLKTNPNDNSLTLSFNKALYSFSLAEQVVNIPDTSIGQRFTLDSLLLPNQTIPFNLSMGLLAQNMLLSPNGTIQLLGQILIQNNGGNMVIPPIAGFSSDIFAFDGSAFFQTATLSRGRLTVAVNNYFPVAISNAVLQVSNGSSGNVILTDTIPYIAANDSIFKFIDISGKTIEGQLKIKLINLDSPGSGGVAVPIDTADYVKLWISLSDMYASDAIARFPSQDLLKTTQEITQVIGDRKLTYIDARSGFLDVIMTSSIQQPMRLTYILEGAYDKSGNPLKAVTNIPAAAPGQPVTINTPYNIAGYSINLTGKDGTKFNTYTQTVVAYTDSTGLLAHITSADSLNIKYVIRDIAPNYIKGYVGTDTISQADTAGFDFLNIFKSGSIDLEEVNMTIGIENGIGVDGEVRINGLTAESANNGSKSLTGSILGQPLRINRATDFPLHPSLNEFAVNNSNSNIRELLGILPNKLRYDVQVKTNVLGNTQQYRDFAYLESALKLSLNAEIPLSIIANHLVLKDTFAFDLSGTNTNVAGISDGVINLIAKNKYPIEAVLTMVMYDDAWAPVDTLVIDTRVAAADLNNSCRADAFKATKVPLYINEDRMTNVKRAKHAVITADFSTVANNSICNGKHLKIYSDYNLDITFTARFNYNVKTHF